ncbi:lipid-A-disaccharide synthase [bacterium]|nr:lipid-A-disaccharide synthase [bacterium]
MRKLMVIAGEASGDLHGGNVIQRLKMLNPELEIIGTGGDLIAAAGARLFYRVEDLAVIGFSEVLKVYRHIKAIFNEMVEKLDAEKPDAVLLVDYPAFNLKFAEEAKKRGIRVIFYVAPQVWAWKKNRIHKIKAFVDELIVLFPFEVAFFKKEGMETHCFGHPLLDIVKPTLDRASFFQKWGLNPTKKTISLLPGSRRNEISKHLPLLCETASWIAREREDVQFLYPLAPTAEHGETADSQGPENPDITLINNDTYNAVAHSDLALVTSGTATLETAILQTPLIVLYKTSLSTYLIGKYLLRIKAIGLPNIIAGREIVPEDPHFISPEKMGKMAGYYLGNREAYLEIKQNLIDLREQLGEEGAYQKTANFINQLI